MEAYERYNRGQLLNDRYLKVEDISEGSYGLVSLAKDTKNENTLVAVKYIYPVDYKRAQHYKELSKKTGRATSSPAKLRSNVENVVSDKSGALSGMCDDSSREIRIHKILGIHPNITNLVDYFGSCLVLEYCPRGDLYEAIQSDFGPSTSQDIKDVFLQILNALTYCHLKLVFHRDLKPENILIADDWLIKVCDWGLATTQQKVTNRSEFDIGSERYMAPELFDDDLTYYDASKVDLWSVGIILLTLVFRKNPFQVANYTDKRFLQFSANREALFDFFSAMSGELFSALRYSLNIDPSNRDLASLQHEIEKLRFFTMDEEYWAEHSDNGEEEDLGYEAEEEEEDRGRVNKKDVDSEDEMFKFDKEKEADAPQDTPATETEHPPSVLSVQSKKALQFAKHINIDVTDSDATTAASARDDDKEDMPYNRRADALLSPITGARPIPISGNNRIRNTRKPFGVASYNKNLGRSNQNVGGSFGARFRREDFFTPRSVVGHYMDKYGEQREQKEQRTEKRRKWNRGRKRQSWKKKGGDNPGVRQSSIYASGHGNGSVYSQSQSSQMSQSQNSQPSHYRKQRNRRSRIDGVPTSSSNYQHPNSYQGSLHASSSSYHQSASNHASLNVYSPVQTPYSLVLTLPVITSPKLASSISTSVGRNLHRHMRSPYKSPQNGAVGVLTEEIDHLALNDDGVFHLEDDFGVVESDPQPSYSSPYRSYEARSIFGNSHGSYANTSSSIPGSQTQNLNNAHSSHNGQGSNFHNYQGFNVYNSNQANNGSHLGSRHGSQQGSHHGLFVSTYGGSNGALAFVSGRPTRRHLVDREAKYVPPNRRGSQSTTAREKRRSFQPGAHHSIHQTLEEAAHSVPNEQWLLRKEWK
ncbi:CIC11C00000002008 [Sungouiella intermedia]|uniref:CIC11C00000002008 n=1 Tax=Sungouiella intermedia TaxID=45354 RepID=A0A1L0CUB6_9ASCO|nr:CIC11C00000002008 [[Candida] intermedia]